MDKLLKQKPGIVLQGKPSPELTEHDRKIEVITGYLEKYASIGNRVMTPQLYAIYIEALEDLELQRIEKGLKEYLRNGQGWPWPGLLREFIEEQI